jgi:hypothetical protein
MAHRAQKSGLSREAHEKVRILAIKTCKFLKF